MGLHRLRKKAWLSLLAEGPGLKPLESIGFIQGAEAPCSLRKAKTGVFPQPVKPPAPSGRQELPPILNQRASSPGIPIAIKLR